MPKRDPIGEFRTLIGLLRAIKDPKWMIRAIGMSRVDVVPEGAFPGTLRIGAQLMPARAGFQISVDHSHLSATPRFRRMMTALGYARVSTGRYWGRGFEDPGAERSRILNACETGESGTVRARTISARSRRYPKVHVLDQRRGWKVAEALSKPDTDGWRPSLLFLRHERRVLAAGRRWKVDYDGYWEPSDRRGLELDLLIRSERVVTPKVWSSLQSSGFMVRLDQEARRRGLRVGMRPRLGLHDFVGRKPGSFLASFERNVRNISDAGAAVRSMMRWSLT